MILRKIATSCLAALVLAGSGLAAAAPAQAASTVKVTHRVANATNFNQQLATCSGPAGFTCTINQSVSATRSVDLALGVTRSFVTSQLKISNAASRSVSVSCSMTLPSNKRKLVAYPVGTQIFYTITKNGETSGTLMAFEPDGASQACYLYA